MPHAPSATAQSIDEFNAVLLAARTAALTWLADLLNAAEVPLREKRLAACALIRCQPARPPKDDRSTSIPPPFPGATPRGVAHRRARPPDQESGEQQFDPSTSSGDGATPESAGPSHPLDLKSESRQTPIAPARPAASAPHAAAPSQSQPRDGPCAPQDAPARFQQWLPPLASSATPAFRLRAASGAPKSRCAPPR